MAQLAGCEVDIKFTIRKNWTIPPEARGQLCLLIRADDGNGTYSAGLLRMNDGFLNPGKNRDAKCTVSAAGRSNILWLIQNAHLPRDVHFDDSSRSATALIALRRLAKTLRRLESIVSKRVQTNDSTWRPLMATYIAAKPIIADDFLVIARADLIRDTALIDSAIGNLEAQLRREFGGRLPDRFLKVKGHRGVHGVLLEYLAKNVGSAVPASWLRLLSGDQVHTERRIRELRDLGFDIPPVNVGGEKHYCLTSLNQETRLSARALLTNRIKDEKRLSPEEKQELLREIV
jgi:Restriction endonuclease NaeI